MTSVSAESVILEAGKSAELVAAFRLVADAEYLGEPRYPAQVCRDLARAVSCRSYATALLELCHLGTAAELLGPGWEGFFWADGLARGRIFRARVQQGLRRAGTRPLRATETGLEIRYPDGIFTVSYARMPFLAALVEFLVTALGYADVDDILGGVGKSPTRASVSAAAAALARRLYDYLKDHLPTAQNQRKFRRLIAFLEERFGPSFDAGAIDDTAVLAFWISDSGQAAEDGLDFKTFVSVFRAFLRLRQSLEQATAKLAIDGALPIGSDREAGEVDPEAVLEAVETVDEYRSPLTVLDSPPTAGVKFLNKREQQDLALLMESGDGALALPLSVLRCEVFGAAQAQITQAVRRKASAGELARLMHQPAETYEARQTVLRELEEHVGRVLLASFHALARCRSREALGLLVALRPDLDMAPLAEILGVDRSYAENVVLLRADSVSDRFLILLEDPTRAGPELSAWLAETRKAFRTVSRQGFRAEDLDRPEIEEGHAAGSKAMLDLRQRLAAFLERLDSLPLPESDWERQFAADRAAFARQFEILYGGDR